MEEKWLKDMLEKEVDEQIRHTEIIEEKILLAAEKKPTSSDSGESKESSDDAVSIADNTDTTKTNDNIANDSASSSNIDASQKQTSKQTSKENEQQFDI